jgi:hypothetical protein
MYVLRADVFLVNEVEREEFLCEKELTGPSDFMILKLVLRVLYVSLYKTKFQVMFISG